MKSTDIMIVGVGGQGTVLASRILGAVALSEGCDVKVSEVHGMSQRGGSVVTYVRYGEKIASPVIDKGGADVILAFETLEAARALPYLKKGGRVVMNAGEIDPMPVITGARAYPQGLPEKIAETANLTAVDALSLAMEAGSAKAVNVVLIGVLARTSDIAKEKWLDALRATVPAKFLDLNLKAFELGYNS